MATHVLLVHLQFRFRERESRTTLERFRIRDDQSPVIVAVVGMSSIVGLLNVISRFFKLIRMEKDVLSG